MQARRPCPILPASVRDQAARLVGNLRLLGTKTQPVMPLNLASWRPWCVCGGGGGGSAEAVGQSQGEECSQRSLGHPHEFHRLICGLLAVQGQRTMVDHPGGYQKHQSGLMHLPLDKHQCSLSQCPRPLLGSSTAVLCVCVSTSCQVLSI